MYQVPPRPRRLDGQLVDGTPFMTIERSQVPDWPFGPGKRFYMILNIEVTSIPAVGSPAGSQFPVEMVVNYVHVWQ